MQLRGLKVHFQEDAELMRGAGPCGCLHGSSSRAGSGTLPRATSTPTEVSGLQGKTRPQEPREVRWEGLPSSGAAAPSLVLCFGRPSAFGEASGKEPGLQARRLLWGLPAPELPENIPVAVWLVQDQAWGAWGRREWYLPECLLGEVCKVGRKRLRSGCVGWRMPKGSAGHRKHR